MNYGSVWRRWDLHVHTPASLLGDRQAANSYYGDWDQYLAELEQKAEQHQISVIGVTDYWTIEGYKRLLTEKVANNRLSNIDFLIPNIEGRLGLQTHKGQPVNFHILIDPIDDDHISKIEDALTHLRFKHSQIPYSCTVDGLTKLGQAYDPSQTNDRGRLKVGIEQFKPNFDEVWNWSRSLKWFRRSVLITGSVRSGGRA